VSQRTLGIAIAMLGGLIMLVAPSVVRFVPTPEDSGVVGKSFDFELLGYADVFADASKKVASGEIKTDKQFYDEVNPKTGEVRKTARAILDAYFQAKLPRDGVNLKPEAAAFLNDIAEQFRKEAAK
jgi:hypothetical protein